MNASKSARGDDTSGRKDGKDLASQKMTMVFLALRRHATDGGTADKVLARTEDFVKALTTADPNSSASSVQPYDGLLRARLETMPRDKLNVLSKSASILQDVHAVVARIHVAAQAELLRREDALKSVEREGMQFLRSLVSGNTTVARHHFGQFDAAMKSVGTFADCRDLWCQIFDKWNRKDLEAARLAAVDFMERGRKPWIADLVDVMNEAPSLRMSTPLARVDRVLGTLLDVLPARDSLHIAQCIQRFQETVAREVPSAHGDVFAIDGYMDRLQWRLQTMSTNSLVELGEAVWSYAKEGADAVIAHLQYAIVADELRRRLPNVQRNGPEAVLAQMSRVEMNDLAVKAAYLFDTAQKRAPNADAKERIPGASFTLQELTDFNNVVNQNLAMRIVREYHLRSIERMTVEERDDAAWAVRLSRRWNVRAPEVDKDASTATKDPFNQQLLRLEQRLTAFDAAQSSNRAESGSTSTTDVPPLITRTRAFGKSVLATQTPMSKEPEKPLESADEEMSALLTILLSGDATAAQVQEQSRRFLTSQNREKNNSSQVQAIGNNNYIRRLRARLETKGPGAVEALVDATAKLKGGNAVVADIHAAAKAVLADRAGGEQHRARGTNAVDQGNSLVGRLGRAVSSAVQRRQEAQTEAQARLETADAKMAAIFAALLSTDPFNLNAVTAVKDFVEAMQAPHGNPIDDDAALGLYADRLNKRLIRMTHSELQALAVAIKGYLLHVEDRVVDGIRLAIEAQLKQRQPARTSPGGLNGGQSS
ncbi:hypothetical protein [Hydrogenophaga sp. BPS33]|uniref:hypothetical protein n=1 Tax=Hydrogenophaga sp. BPS33 TaxID=2651974 RepID=UPI00131F657D|nr:hypothetical protein [Hydrogenophaga sp. BPS33]QHE86492.1 hypothetical protein F9K07_17085 [Hydrogenophaga sp. BPS33]